MADRHDERFRNEPSREHGRNRDDRGFVERAGDEVRSWFGDEDAERRREMDERERERDRGRERSYGRDWNREPERGWSDRERGWSDRDRSWSVRDRGWSERERGWPGREGERGSSGERWSSGYGPYGSDRSRRGEYGGGYGSYGTAAARGDEPGREGEWRGSAGRSYGYGPTYGWSSAGTGREYASGYGSDFGTERWRERDRGYSGRGPKGYQRSDNRVMEDVCDRLADAPDLDASNIEVKVNGGEVTLSGTVDDRFDKRRAEDLIEDISGVQEVHNNLRLHRGQENFGGGPGGNQGSPQGGNPNVRR